MTYRKTILVNNEVYHLVNRTIAQVPLFLTRYDYLRFLSIVEFYRHQNVPLRFSYFSRLSNDDQVNIVKNLEKQNQPLVEIIAFCLMSNHTHFLVKQLTDKGISIFMSKIQDSYAKYFNLKNKRTGSLFQAMFKAIRIETDEQLIHVSRYIHLNPCTAYLCQIKDLKRYAWSSFPHYLNLKTFKFLSPNLVLDLFQGPQAYEKFVFDQADYQKKLGLIKHLAMEN